MSENKNENVVVAFYASKEAAEIAARVAPDLGQRQ